MASETPMAAPGQMTPGPVAGAPAPFGVYVHVPFCRRRCDYCAFATYTDRDHLMVRYVDACIAQLRLASAAGLPPATSVFVGGGTPSRLPADELCRLLAEVPVAPGAEVTAECNPEDAGPDRLAAWRRAGVTRVSFGVQSTSRRVLAALGRGHDPGCVDLALSSAAAAGLDSYNVDLIFGAAGETAQDWDRTLSDVLDRDEPPPHVSCYALTVEPGTPLARDEHRHPDDDVQAARYERADARLAAAGYRWEEISNWAKPGHGCRHNRLYWDQGDYLGVGSSAHSHAAGHRWWNVRTPERYIDALGSSTSPVAGEERLSGPQRRFEALALSLRTPAGVPDRSLPDAPELRGLVVRRRGRAVLTVRGRLLANAVTARLDPDPDPGADSAAGTPDGPPDEAPEPSWAREVAGRAAGILPG